MRDVIYISDFYWPTVKGGAERYDKVLYDHLETKGNLKKKIISDNLKKGHVDEWDDCLFVVSNFAKMSGEQRHLVENDVDYIIIEHDYKLDDMRQPQRHSDYDIPDQCLRNEPFYQNAEVVVMQSSLQLEIFEKNLDDVDYYNFSGSLWSHEDLKFLDTCRVSGAPRKEAVIVDSDNPIKGTNLAKKYCRKHDIDYNLVSSEDENEFWREMSIHEKLIYLPLTPETFGRIAVEAKVMGLNVVTNENLGALYEDWFHENPKDVYREMKGKLEEMELLLLEYS